MWGLYQRLVLHRGTYEEIFIIWLMGKCVEIGFNFGSSSMENTYLGCADIFPPYRGIW